MPEQLHPKHVGGYILHHRLGAGGSGTVWQAEDGAGHRVALKLLHPLQAADEVSRQRLKREARLVNQIQGPGVSQVLDYEADDSEPFIVTEFIDGPTLSQVIANGPLSSDEAAELADRLREILTRVHAAEVVHRDLKPSNVIMSDTGPCLIDFGIAQEDSDERMTRTGLITGTPGFISPELLTSGGDASFDVRIQGDWWGWSALVLNALTGRPPFGVGRNEGISMRLFQGDPDVAGLPEHLQTQFRRALAVDPQNRPGPEELVAALRQPTPMPVETPTAAPNAQTETDLLTAAHLPDVTRVHQVFPAQAPFQETAVAVPGSTSTPMGPLIPDGWFGEATPNPLYSPRRLPFFPLSALAVVCWLGMLPASFAGVGLMFAAFILVFLSWIGAGSQWVEKRRIQQGGPKSSDAGIALALFPKHLFTGTLVAIPGLAVAAATGVLAWMLMTGSASLGWETLTEWITSSTPMVTNPISVWLISVITLAVAYLFPPSSPMRRGLQLTVLKAAPNRWVRALVASALIAGALLLIVLMQESAAIF